VPRQAASAPSSSRRRAAASAPAGGSGSAPAGLECAPQAGDVRLRRGDGHRRRGVAPEQVHEGVGGDRPAGVQRERGEQAALLGRAEVDGGAVTLDGHRTQDRHLHGRTLSRGDHARPAFGRES
jgi:hypothetical protein